MCNVPSQTNSSVSCRVEEMLTQWELPESLGFVEELLPIDCVHMSRLPGLIFWNHAGLKQRQYQYENGAAALVAAVAGSVLDVLHRKVNWQQAKTARYDERTSEQMAVEPGTELQLVTETSYIPSVGAGSLSETGMLVPWPKNPHYC